MKVSGWLIFMSCLIAGIQLIVDMGATTHTGSSASSYAFATWLLVIGACERKQPPHA